MNKKIIKPQSVDEMFAEIDEEQRKHPVRTALYRVFFILRNMPRDIKLKIKTFIQRGKRGYANSDVWGFSDYLSDVISHGVRHLKENQNGHPNGLTEGQWVDILNKISYTFEVAKEIAYGDTIYVPIKKYSERGYKKWAKVAKDINKKYKDYPRMRVLTKKQVKEFEEGFKLFQEYFFDLWD